jgi:hypothetical protein
MEYAKSVIIEVTVRKIMTFAICEAGRHLPTPVQAPDTGVQMLPTTTIGINAEAKDKNNTM